MMYDVSGVMQRLPSLPLRRNNFHITALNAACTSYLFKKTKLKNMIKVKWRTVLKVLKFVGTVITTVAGTLAVQSCM